MLLVLDASQILQCFVISVLELPDRCHCVSIDDLKNELGTIYSELRETYCMGDIMEDVSVFIQSMLLTH